MNEGLNGPRPSGPRPYGPQQVIIQPPKGYVPPLRNELTPVGVYDTYTGYWVGLPIEALVEALVLAEKQYTLDKVDPRTDGAIAHVTIPDGAALNVKKTADIEVPSGEVWYLCEHEITIEQNDALVTTGIICVNFRVSSFPKVDSEDMLYYSEDDPQVYLVVDGAKSSLVATHRLWADHADIAAGDVTDHKLIVTHGYIGEAVAKDFTKELKRDFREGDELNTELRLVAGNKLTLEAVVEEALTPTQGPVEVYLRVWGRRGKVLVPHSQ